MGASAFRVLRSRHACQCGACSTAPCASSVSPGWPPFFCPLQGCCTENARKNGGYLIDFEINTARRFWGAKKVRGLAGIQFQILDD